MAHIEPDDLEAVRAVVAALQEFGPADQERIIRWAREKLGLSTNNTPDVGRTDEIIHNKVSSSTNPIDIKTFVNSKSPKTANQFAATVAYYYRFEAPEQDKKESITSSDLQEACRQVGRARFEAPAQTLVNAHSQGYLTRTSERGAYQINTVGENLVAMTLPDPGARASAPRPPRQKVKRKIQRAPKKAR